MLDCNNVIVVELTAFDLSLHKAGFKTQLSIVCDVAECTVTYDSVGPDRYQLTKNTKVELMTVRFHIILAVTPARLTLPHNQHLNFQ